MIKLIKSFIYSKFYKIEKCCINNEYKKINSNINIKGKFFNIGKMPICKNCYYELISD